LPIALGFSPYISMSQLYQQAVFLSELCVLTCSDSWICHWQKICHIIFSV